MSATYWSGAGGLFTIGTTNLAVKEWKLKPSATLADITNANSGGWRQRLSVVSDFDLSATIVWDSTATPESLSFGQGATGTVTLQIGNSTKKYTAVPVIVESYEITGCTEEGAVMYSFSMKGNGTLPAPA